MPTAKPTPALTLEGRFPAIEEFIERASPEEVQRLFEPLRSALAGLKGPQKAQAQRLATALDRTDELLRLLLQTREILSKSRPGKR